MRGHIIVEDRFLHQGTEHHLFVSQIEGVEYEYRFEVRCLLPGTDQHETVFEKTEDLSRQLAQCPNTTIDQLIMAEVRAIRNTVNREEDIHAHDP